MCLTRIYARRRRDGRILRFNSTKSMRDYCRKEHETKRSLPIITRDEFIAQRGEEYHWVRSERHPGMALLAQ